MSTDPATQTQPSDPIDAMPYERLVSVAKTYRLLAEKRLVELERLSDLVEAMRSRAP